MSPALDVIAFVGGALVSLSTSWLVVSRLERLGERFGFSEALLGLVAALAADTPEISSAITAVLHHQRQVGIGVIVGSNVFNLAALLGLGAVVAKRITLHRKVVLFAGTVSLWIALVCLGAVAARINPALNLALALVALVPYAIIISIPRRFLADRSSFKRQGAWLLSAVSEEESELLEAIRPTRGTTGDGLVAVVALAIVVGSSALMERSASDLGTHFAIPQIVTGGVILAAVTSLPNMVAAIHLASRGRGPAVLSEALNSNTLNVVAGLLLPAVIVGPAASSGRATLATAWFVGLSVFALLLAYVGRGLGVDSGWTIIACYLAFVVVLVI